MRAFKIISLMFLLIFSVSILKAQSQAAIQMLYLNPSPRLNGLGMVGTSLPNDDPFGFYYNPAQLGHFSQTNNLSYELYPSNVNWLNLNFLTYRNSAVDIGYNFKNELNGLSLSAGLGYIHSKFDYGTIFSTPSLSPDAPVYEIHPYDEYDAYSLGIGIDYYIQFSIGITYKNIHSDLGSFHLNQNNQEYYMSAKISTLDYGFLLTVPIVKLIDHDYKFNLLQNIPAVPYFNFSIGYSRLNQGGEVTYNDPNQADPLPRTARLGYTLSTGLDIKLHNNLFRLFGYDFTVEADNLLINPIEGIGHVTYKSGIGDINIGRNLILLKSNDNVVVHKAHEFNLFETFTVLIGRFDGNGYYNDESDGIGLRLKGIFTLLKAYTNNKPFNFIADHFDIQYYSTKLDIGSGIGSKFEGINFSFYGFDF